MKRLASAAFGLGSLLVASASTLGCSSGTAGSVGSSGSAGSSTLGSSTSGTNTSGVSTSGTSTSGTSASGTSAGSGSAGATAGQGTGDEDASPGGATDAGASKDAATKDASVHDAGVADAHEVSDASGALDALAAARAQCVQIINADRATLTPPSAPLAENTAEEACVDMQAQADFTANTAHSAFGNCKEQAQDECPGWPGPPSSIMTNCLAQMWAEGPPPAGTDNHWLNMSNARYTKVACGFYQTPSGSWWATQDFWP